MSDTGDTRALGEQAVAAVIDTCRPHVKLRLLAVTHTDVGRRLSAALAAITSQLGTDQPSLTERIMDRIMEAVYIYAATRVVINVAPGLLAFILVGRIEPLIDDLIWTMIDTLTDASRTIEHDTTTGIVRWTMSDGASLEIGAPEPKPDNKLLN